MRQLAQPGCWTGARHMCWRRLHGRWISPRRKQFMHMRKSSGTAHPSCFLGSTSASAWPCVRCDCADLPLLLVILPYHQLNSPPLCLAEVTSTRKRCQAPKRLHPCIYLLNDVKIRSKEHSLQCTGLSRYATEVWSSQWPVLTMEHSCCAGSPSTSEQARA